MIILIIKILFIFINVLIGIYDFSFYRIPNLFLMALLVLFGLTAPFTLGLNEIINSFIIFGVVFFVCLILFLTKIFGAGDAKYLAAIALWMGYPDVIPFILYTSIAGAGLALIYLIAQYPFSRFSDLTWTFIQKIEAHLPLLEFIWIGSGTGPEKGKREHIKPKTIPYGVAIATGAIIMMISGL
ncbi:MAG: prepilin peptidase [Alphaproteobacteria bacterium]|nr:prepilin peptidase [Alphaproteobacteria bacterium]